jgi:hypothetical protein
MPGAYPLSAGLPFGESIITILTHKRYGLSPSCLTKSSGLIRDLLLHIQLSIEVEWDSGGKIQFNLRHWTVLSSTAGQNCLYKKRVPSLSSSS